MVREPRIRPLEPEGKEAGGGDRLPTMISGLDERMGGGIPKGFLVLVAGPVGSLKSSICFSIALHAARRGAKSLYISLEQDSESLLGQMASLGLDPSGVAGMQVVDLAGVRQDIDEERADWLESILGLLERYKRERGCDVLVLDSLDALYSLVTFTNPRRELFHFFQRLRALKATTLLVSEIGLDEKRFGKHGVEEFLSDGILHLRLREVESAQLTSVRRYVGVVKMRKTAHDTDYHPFLVTREGFELILK
ncbi:MAG: ATPase domain-containing protein [Thermoplasmata archaeon]